jgi:hypothetical protein
VDVAAVRQESNRPSRTVLGSAPINHRSIRRHSNQSSAPPFHIREGEYLTALIIGDIFVKANI